MLDWSQCPAVERVPGKVSGAWLFRGTRVPVSALFENLEDGATVNQFLDWFPGVTWHSRWNQCWTSPIRVSLSRRLHECYINKQIL